MTVNPGLIVGGVFVAAALAGVAYLAYGAPSRDARQTDYPRMYGTPRYGGKSKRKTKRRKA